MPLARTARTALAPTLVALFLPCGIASAQDFSGFRIPDHRVLNWRAAFFGNGSRNRNSDEEAVVHNRQLNGSASSRLDALRDSDPMRTAWTVEIAATGSRLRSQVIDQVSPFYPPSWGSRGSETRRVDERWRLRLEDRRYPWDAPLGIELGLEGAGQYRQSWSRYQDEHFQEYFGSDPLELQSRRGRAGIRQSNAESRSRDRHGTRPRRDERGGRLGGRGPATGCGNPHPFAVPRSTTASRSTAHP